MAGTFKALPDADLRPIRGDEGEHPGDVLVTPLEKKAADPILHHKPQRVGS